MGKVDIKPGDTVARIAGTAGLAPETIWSHPSNAELKDQRDHMDVLAVGDQLSVPEPSVKTVEGNTCRRYRFRRRGVPMRFILQILGAWGSPRKERPYRLIVDGIALEGMTDENGVLRHFLPNAAKAGKLHLDELELDLPIGVLEPKSNLLGVQQRLNNLGFHCLNDAGELGQSTVSALIRFQRLMKLPATGELDDVTRTALNGNHQELNLLSRHLANTEPEL